MTMKNYGLYRPEFEFDSCGVGFVANIKGVKSHKVVADAITMLENMEHRGATGYESNTGDGAGIQIQIPHELLDEGFYLWNRFTSIRRLWGRNVFLS